MLGPKISHENGHHSTACNVEKGETTLNLAIGYTIYALSIQWSSAMTARREVESHKVDYVRLGSVHLAEGVQASPVSWHV